MGDKYLKEKLVKAMQSTQMALDDLKQIQRDEGNCLQYERAANALRYTIEQFDIKLNEKGE